MQSKLLSFLFIGTSVIGLMSFNALDSKKNNSHLFTIERSKDENEICYDINTTETNKLDSENPISVYWIKHTEYSKTEPLTRIQKNYAYGLTYLRKRENEAVFQFVSYSKKYFTIKKDESGNFKVIITSENQLVEVKHIFIQIDGGTFWIPKITRVELHAKNLTTG